MLKLGWITLLVMFSSISACEKTNPASKADAHADGDGHDHKAGDGHDHNDEVKHKDGDGHEHKDGDGHAHKEGEKHDDAKK